MYRLTYGKTLNSDHGATKVIHLPPATWTELKSMAPAGYSLALKETWPPGLR